MALLGPLPLDRGEAFHRLSVRAGPDEAVDPRIGVERYQGIDVRHMKRTQAQPLGLHRAFEHRSRGIRSRGAWTPSRDGLGLIADPADGTADHPARVPSWPGVEREAMVGTWIT